MQNHNSKLKTYTFGFKFPFFKVGLGFFAVFSLLTAFANQSVIAAEPQSGPAIVTTKPAPIVQQVCSQIYRGDFAAAREILEQDKSKATPVAQLADIVSEYEAIDEKRQAERKVAYKEQLAKLEEFREAADTTDVADTGDVNDVNEANNITSVLLVIAKANEFADEQQKSQLLSDSFVKLTFQKAIDKAAEFESKGKWLDAYITCYSWLQAIEPDNEAYSDYAEQLLEKANIAASFQDSPCETQTERYEGVKKQMFIKAIDALNFNYVSVINLDYRQMATKGIKRCESLAKVVNSSSVVRDVLYDEKDTQYDKGLAAWSVALSAILDEVNVSPTGISKDKFIDVFENALTLNATTAGLPRPMLITQFAEAALSALDPYTVMIWPRQSQDFKKMLTNEFTGIGIEISKQKGLLTVASLLPDTPAYKSGLDAGDTIEAADGVLTKDMTLICAVRKITGPAGTKVTLTIKRPGEEQSRDITITRARITVPTIRGWQRTEAGKWLYMIDDENKIGYVRITSFSDRTADDFEKVLCRLEAEGLKGLILDLRFNSGGLLNSAVEVTDKFLEEGLIVSTRPRFGLWTWSSAHEKNTHPNYPLVVLINSSSASASEIVAGALADKTHNRAILVGNRTHGKGSVQGITSYPGKGAQLKYTMAYYHLPSGQRVESQEAMKKRDSKDWGIGPDVKIKLRSDELKNMIDFQRDNDVLVKADHDNGAVPLKKHTAEETFGADPQLAAGVLIIKTKLTEKSWGSAVGN